MLFFLCLTWAEDNWISGELAKPGQRGIGYQAGLPKLGKEELDFRRACPDWANEDWIQYGLV